MPKYWPLTSSFPTWTDFPVRLPTRPRHEVLTHRVIQPSSQCTLASQLAQPDQHAVHSDHVRSETNSPIPTICTYERQTSEWGLSTYERDFMNGQRTPHFVPFAGINCKFHGPVDIDRANYDQQMGKPNSFWVCPRCGSTAQFDDDRFEELNPQE